MSKRQIEKDFQELYLGKEQKILLREYYKKKKRDLVILLLCAIFIILFSLINEKSSNGLGEENSILRNKNGEGSKNVSIQVMAGEGEWQDFSFILQEKEYTKEELEELSKEAIKEIPKVILGKNDNLEHITEDLELITQLEEFPFSMRWESSRADIMDYQGHLLQKESLIKEQRVQLNVILEYGDWEKSHTIQVSVVPVIKKDFLYFLKQNIESKEKISRYNIEFLLPKDFQNVSLKWRYEKNNTALILGILFLFILPFLSYQKDRDIHKLAQMRKAQLLEMYPEFVGKLILYMEAGMSTKGAMFRIANEYQKSTKKKYIYEELIYICRQISNGMSEKEGYELLGKRCDLPCYRKLSSLLMQHLEKGSYGIAQTLRIESQKASEEQRKILQKKGEEMGTKLLFPMMIMLGIVMVLIMVPALFSFQM